MITVRRGQPADLPAIHVIQASSAEAAQWDPAQYLEYDFFVATADGVVAGFLVARMLAPGECEILNLAVSPEWRRRGVARALVAALLEAFRGDVFLEVRPSNDAARTLYRSMGFEELLLRPDYYESPLEAAIVMKLRSC